MKIVVVGRGNVGGGLARLWSQAGHEVITLGRDGGDGSGADVIVIAVPSQAIAAALAKVTGLAGQVTIDTTNAFEQRPSEFPSLAHQVKSIVGGPTAKSFNTNFAALYDQITGQRVRPSNLFAADADARDTAEQLIVDAGYDPVFVGSLDHARTLEDHLSLVSAAASGGLGPFFYRMAAPGQL